MLAFQTRIVVCQSLLLVAMLCSSSVGQTRTFSSPDIEFKLELPSPQWKILSRLDVHDHVEFSNGDDPGNGYLRLRKRLVASGTTALNLFQEDEKWELALLPGYVACRNGAGVDFDGPLVTSYFSYEFTNNGRRMDGRIYYVRTDPRTFYSLHFTVFSNKLSSFGETMDLMARSFRLK